MSLTFPAPPEIPLWRLALRRAPGLRGDATIPRIEAHAERISGDAEAYGPVCGFPTADPLPPTWPAVATTGLQLAVMAAPAFPLPVLGIVHVRQQLTWTRPLAASEPLSARCTVEGHRVVRRGGEFDLVTAVSAGGETVWSGVTTILSRAVRGDGIKLPRPEEPAWTPARTATWTLPAGLGRQYAAVSGDWNPIHLHPLTAWLFGLPRPIMHGWWLLARALAELGADVPPAGRLDVRFLAPVSLPGTVTFAAAPDGAGVRFRISALTPCVVGRVDPLVPR